MKRYSFVIPTYRNKEILKNTLEALNGQVEHTREDYEVIVVDDGSGDDTHDYIQGVNRDYDLKYIYLERCEDSCRSRARNRGWREADGEIVVFIDSDIIVRKNYLKELDRCFAAGTDVQVIGNRIMLLEDIEYERVRDGSVYRSYDFNSVRPDMLELRHFVFNKFSYNSSGYHRPWLYVFSCNLAVPKKCLERVGGFDEKFKGYGVEDSELGYRLYMSGVRIVINSRLEGVHQFHGNPHGVPQEKFREIEGNLDYFLSKHGSTIDIPTDELFNFHKAIGKAKIFLGVKPEGPKRREVVELKDGSRLEEVKDAVLRLSDRKGISLVVNDYTEDTDLDIWVQGLGRRNSTPKYFPMSKKIAPGLWAKIRPHLYK